MTPRFSVVIPLYNKAAHIQRALDSVLAQTLGDFELLVINDGSSDGGETLVEACADPRVGLVNQLNQGVSAARNKGVALAAAPYVAFLDADDAWKPGFLAEISRLIDASPDSALFATAYEMVSPDGKTRDYSAGAVGSALSSGVFLDYLDCVGRDSYPFYTSSACVNKAAFVDCGGFDQTLQIGEDVAMWLALSLRAPACFSPMAGATYHRDAENRAMNQSGRSGKILAYVRKLVTSCRGATLSAKQATDFKGLISHNLYRSCVGFMRSGETARAKQLMGEFDEFLLPRQRRRLSRKALKYTLLGPFLRARHGSHTPDRSDSSGPGSMRILQILHNHKFGGAEQHLVQLCVGLRAAGHEVEAAVPRGSWVWQRLEELGFTVHGFDFRAHYDVGSLLRLIVLLLRRKYDIVHTHLVRAAFYGRFATRLTGTPLVSSVHDMSTWKNYPRRRGVIAVSAAVKRHLVSRAYTDACIRVVFPGARDCSLGADTAAARQAIRAELGLAPAEVAVFVIGRVAEVKGHDLALEAARRLRGQVRMFFAGQETAWGSALHAHDSDHAVTWLGRRDDVPRLLAAADICIQPSRSEGLPLALMEASSAGKAMIATQVGGVPEVIEDHRNGLLIPPDNVEALVDAILLLVRDPALAEGFGVEARKRFDAQFSIETMIGATLGVYSECLQASPART